ncbi:MAG: hypothetical protein ABEH38_09345 [Flavobacteriales bacterium]
MNIRGIKGQYAVAVLFLFFTLLASKPAHGQDEASKKTPDDSLRNAVGFELLGRDVFNFYSFGYRRKLGEGRRHWVNLNWSFRILKPSEMSLGATYSFIPLRFRSFKLKTGIGLSQNFAFWKEPGASVDPRQPDRPFYKFMAFGELGFHFTLSKRISLEVNYIPIGYWLKDEDGKKNSFREGVKAPNDGIWGGIQVNYSF